MYKESEVAQSCLTLCDPMDCSPPSSSPVGFSKQGYWSGLPFPSPGDLPDSGIEPRSPTLQPDALISAPPGKPLNTRIQVLTSKISKGGKEARLKEEGGGGGIGIQMSLLQRRLSLTLHLNCFPVYSLLVLMGFVLALILSHLVMMRICIC